MKGKKPQPTKMKILKDNPGRRPLNENEPEPEKGELRDPPEHIGEHGKKEWQRLAPILHGLGLLTEADYPAFEAYCQTYSRWVDAELFLQEHGSTETTTNGNIIQSPVVGIANTSLQIMLKYMSEFGLTPSSRSRVSVTKGKENKFSKYQGGKK